MTATERHFLLDLAHFTFGRTLRIAAVAGLCAGAALTYNAAFGPSYTASMRVLVTPSAGSVAVPGAEAGTGAAATLVVQDHGQTARNQAELLSDPGLLRKLLPDLQALPRVQPAGQLDHLLALLGQSWRVNAERVGLLTPASEAERFAAQLSHALSVRAVGDTDVIKLDFTWGDRIFAARALNVIVAGYQRAIADTVEARASLLRAQAALGGSQTELAAIDQRVAAAKAALLTASAGSDAGQIAARLDRARSATDALRVERELVRRKLASAEQSYKSGGWVDAGDAQAANQSRLAQNFAELLKKRQAAVNDGSPDNPGTADIDKQILQLREQNYRHVKLVLSGQLHGLDDEISTADAAIAHDEDAMRDIGTQTAQMQILAESRSAKAAAVSASRRQFDAAQQGIDAAWQEVGGTRALSQAFPPAEPNWPAPPLLLKFSGVFGLLAGFGSAIWAERNRRTIDRPIDISRRLGIDVLARLDDVPVAQLR